MPEKTDQGSRAKRVRGPGDPNRRVRIAEAAIAVAMTEGLDAVTHRRVAAEADVPLGSTTYYFRTIDDLLAVAMEMAAQRGVEALQLWESQLPKDADMAEALTSYVMDLLGDNRSATDFESNLYALAYTRRALRKAAADWDLGLTKVLCHRTDEVTGKMLGVALCGLQLQLVLSDEMPKREEILRIFRRALAGGLD